MKNRILMVLAGGALGIVPLASAGDDNLLRADSAERTSALAAAGAGWEKGNFYISDGGNNTLKVYGYAQFRYLMNFRDEASAGDQDDFTHGFQMRRTRVGTKGSIWDKNLTYDIQGEFSRSSGAFTLMDAIGQYKWDNGFSVKWGQYKLPYLREELVSDTKLQTIERSVVNNVFSLTRGQAVSLGYETEKFRGSFAFSDGANSLNTDFTSGSEADYGFTGRGEFRWGDGDFKRFEDFSSWRGSKYAGMVGLAATYQDGGETGGTADVAIGGATIDASIEGNGWNVYAAGIWQNTDASGGSSTDDLGFIVQGGFFVTDQVELYGRWDSIFADDANGDDFNSLTAGMHYYISPESHAVKFSADIVYYIDAEGDNALVGANSGTPILSDTEDSQWGLRLQMQVVF